MADLIKVTCPNCGKVLDVPGELEEFSCLYCGVRSRVAALLAPPVDCAAVLPELREKLLDTVKKHPDYYKKLDKKQFFDAFELYESSNTETLRTLDACMAAQPELMNRICTELVDDLESHMSADPRWKRKAARSNVFWEVKVVLAIFLTPLARKLGLACAEDFRTGLHRSWLARWPQERWEPGDYDVLVSGYKKRKFCFITTATCRHEGKTDDCPELQTFRAFRDGWLTERGETALIDRYYAVAPAIVACIDYCDDPAARYAEIRSRWLEPCYRALREDRPADCRSVYMEMVQTLEGRYLHENSAHGPADNHTERTPVFT